MNTFKNLTKYVFLFAVIGILSVAVGCSNDTAPPTSVTGITVTGASDATSVANGETLQMSAAVLPADALDMSVTWSVINGTGTATISESGLLSATSAGAITVKATANDGSEIEGTLALTVTATNAEVSIMAISGLTAPERNVTPDVTITATDEYTGTVSWAPSDSPYAAATVYTATITLTAKAGYTFTGVDADTFTVVGATSTNAVDSGVITAVFPATGAAPDTAVTLSAIPGVTVPVIGETPDTTAIDTDQYTGTITWLPADSPYAASTAYTATITLTAKTGYTFSGVAANSFTVADATSTNAVNSGIVSATFPETAAAPDAAITIAAITGVTVPERNVTPDMTVVETAQYTATISWDPADSPYEAATVYTATITLTAKTGFTLTGVAANSFTVAGATATNAADSGVVTAVFPATGAAPDVAVNLTDITGVTVPVRNVTPDLTVDETDQYTATIAWAPDHSPYSAGTVYTATITLTAKTGYTLNGVAADSFIVAGATSTNAVNSGVVTAVFPATDPDDAVTLLAISGVTIPARDASPDFVVPETDQYSASIAWAPVHDPYAASTVYTATITLTAKTGYTFIGVSANSFTVLGATATNLVNSGVVTAVFPETTAAPLTAVPLGTSENYVILAKTTVTTTGVTAITGDLGLSPAATSFFTGFDLTNATGYATSALVTGKLYASDMADPTPANLTTAVSNMETAYTNAAGRINPDFLDLGTGAIGGMTLGPALYKWNSAVGIGSDLTLNGGADEVWIFQISGALNVATDVSVLLTGGARAENVFWQVAENASLGTGSHMEGIILGQTQINLQTGSSVNGRLLAQTQVTLDAATVVGPAVL